MIFVKILGREGGQHDQHCVKNKFVKNRVGGRGVNLNLNNVFKYTVCLFLTAPLRKNCWYMLLDDWHVQSVLCCTLKIGL